MPCATTLASMYCPTSYHRPGATASSTANCPSCGASSLSVTAKASLNSRSWSSTLSLNRNVQDWLDRLTCSESTVRNPRAARCRCAKALTEASVKDWTDPEST